MSAFFAARRGQNKTLAQDLLGDFLTRPHVTKAMIDTLAAPSAANRTIEVDPTIAVLRDVCRAGSAMPSFPTMPAVWQRFGAAQAQVIAGADASATAHRLAGQLAELARSSTRGAR